VSARWVATFAVRFVVFGVAWWVVSEGEPPLDLVPLLVVAAAAGASLPFVPPGSNPLRWRGVVRFVPYFLAQSVAGGVDVALRAWNPRLPIEPGVVRVPLLLQSESARITFAWAVSLLPGTVAAVLADDELTIHALDTTLPLRERLLELERRVADVFAAEDPGRVARPPGA
jgi:multicomponent Na+:H+ antiporter subunit E